VTRCYSPPRHILNQFNLCSLCTPQRFLSTPQFEIPFPQFIYLEVCL
jgi:hypothetical protein